MRSPARVSAAAGVAAVVRLRAGVIAAGAGAGAAAVVAAAVLAPAPAAPAAGIPPTGAPPAVASPCVAEQLAASFTMIPNSNAAGQVEYVLTVSDRSPSVSCTLSAPLSMQLRGTGDASLPSLPTHATTFPRGRYMVTLAPRQWAQAPAQFSPDVPGPGEPGRGNCEPVARALRLQIAGSPVTARMDPSPVCEHGALAFRRLKAVPVSPACSARGLSADVARDSQPFSGRVFYTLALRNRTGHPCHTPSIVGLGLLGPGGRALRTRVTAKISSPFRFVAHGSAHADLLLRSSGPDCQGRATRLRIFPGRGAGRLSARLQPPLNPCRGGLIGLSSLYAIP